MEAAVRDALMGAGVDSFGLLDRASLCGAMGAQGQEKLESLVPGWRGIVCAVVPYYAGEDGASPGGGPQLARYARGEDYHGVLRRLLSGAAEVLEAGGHRACVLVDASPIPEVWAAAACGLGQLGRSGLLLTPVWGSWVFIGCIVTDAPLSFGAARPIVSCADCGACVRACPAGALGDGGQRAACLSGVSQRSGELSGGERALLRGSGVIWGCDRCQEVCPANRGAARTQIAAFREDLVFTLPPTLGQLRSRRELEQLFPRRAFTWKGLRVLQRNLGLFEQENGENRG